MSAGLELADGEALADLATYVARARTLDEDGAIRLQAAARPQEDGGVLAAWVCVLPGAGLQREGLVLGLRTLPLSGGDLPVDTTVPLAGLTDRFARRAATGDATTYLPVPPTTVAPPWAGTTPPRGGWEPVGLLPVADLLDAARSGIAEVAQGAPTGSGASAVATLRSRVWGRPLVPGVPAGVGLGAHALGFAGGAEHATVHRAGPWVRVSLPAGHLLARPAAA